ncbi:MAG: FAD binding domain-containing protein [Candidatus Riflebacteria bacterium]|nr:FAD binding domain-containing protein [Candidatus Riflebacteria bacterium]
MPSLIINDQDVRTEAPPGEVLLDLIREERRLTGTKEACREGECGACTVLVGTPGPTGVTYRACASCLLPIGDVEGCHVVTVEGLGVESLTVVQRLIVEHSASQCGFCTPGIVLSLTGFCLASETLCHEDALDALDGNICRCTGYAPIRAAARGLSEDLRGRVAGKPKRVEALVEAGVLPRYFLDIPGRLRSLATRPAAGRPGKDEVLVAGGTDLFVQKPEELREAPLAFLSRRRDLDYVTTHADSVRVGGAVTIEEFRTSPEVLRHFPTMKSDLVLHSSAILRNKATLTGNIVNASPVGDATIILLALGARLVIEGVDGAVRETPLSGFFTGYKKMALSCGELVREIVIPFLGSALFNFEKVSNRVTLDIAAVNTALRLQTAPDGAIADLRVSAGGVAPVPLLIGGLERYHGRKADEATGAAVAQVVAEAVTPIDDIRGSAVYKRLLLGQLVKAHFAVITDGRALR